MLLPSAFGCDSSGPKTRYQTSNGLLASPPLSPQTSTATTIFSTCRALQSMLTTPNQLPSPPTTHSESPFKLRLRARKADSPSPSPFLAPRRRITKRAIPAPRGENKRCRADDDQMDRLGFGGEDEDDVGSELDDDENASEMMSEPPRPSTPKRQRIAPEVLPLGLERSDYHTLHLQQVVTEEQERPAMAQYPVLRGFDFVPRPQAQMLSMGEQEWTNEDDRMLVELVLEKLKLSKSEWQDCARSLGKDRGSVGRRWKSLVSSGDVGLKGRAKRTRIHGSWR